MEALGLYDAMASIGDSILPFDVVNKSALLGMLTSAGVSVPTKAQLIRLLASPGLLEVCLNCISRPGAESSFK